MNVFTGSLPTEVRCKVTESSDRGLTYEQGILQSPEVLLPARCAKDSH